MDIWEKLDLFQEMIQCNTPVSTWLYDKEGALCGSNCADEAVLDEAFTLFGLRDAMLIHGKKNTSPLYLSTPIGLSWGAAFLHQNGALAYICVIGPVFSGNISASRIDQTLNQLTGGSTQWRIGFRQALATIPSVMLLVFQQYLAMLHYCATGSCISPNEITYPDSEAGCLQKEPLTSSNRHYVWQAEQGLMNMVREGNLNYREATSYAFHIGSQIPVLSTDSLRKPKDSVIIFISLCSRAAIEGGLSPNIAYPLGDSYIQAVESSTSLSELTALSETMYDDFIRKVHNAHIPSGVSAEIRALCTYIETHMEEKLKISDLAKHFGYAEYYLSRKFKAEMQIPLKDYMKQVRIKSVKLLLAHSDLSMQEIADRLGYCARSYMTADFCHETGCAPSEYRKEHRII